MKFLETSDFRYNLVVISQRARWSLQNPFTWLAPSVRPLLHCVTWWDRPLLHSVWWALSWTLLFSEPSVTPCYMARPFLHSVWWALSWILLHSEPSVTLCYMVSPLVRPLLYNDWWGPLLHGGWWLGEPLFTRSLAWPWTPLRERLSLGPHPCLELYLSFLVSTGLMRYVPQAWIEIRRFWDQVTEEALSPGFTSLYPVRVIFFSSATWKS